MKVKDTQSEMVMSLNTIQITMRFQFKAFLKKTPLTLLMIILNILNLNTLMSLNTNNQLKFTSNHINNLNQSMMMICLTLCLLRLMTKEEEQKSEDTNLEDIQMTIINIKYQDLINLKRLMSLVIKKVKLTRVNLKL